MQAYLENIPAWLMFALGLLLVILLGYIDYLTGDYSILIFYLIPVALVTWYLGKWGGLIISVASGAARLVSDYSNYAHANLRYWNSLQDMLFLLIVAILIVSLKKQLVDDE
jgi:hypothetical protein